jgi:glycosyltransferase involved in cell wall biosynthesis
MNSRKAKVDILIPTYNREQYIEQCIDSILNQTYKDINIIIYDDGSTDKTRQIIEYYQKFHSNIQYIRGVENRGVGFARNILLESSKAEYIAWQDSDDISNPYRIEKSLNYIEHTGVDILFTDMIFYVDGASYKRSKTISKVDIYKYTKREGLVNNMNFATAFFNSRLKSHKFDESLLRKEDVKWISNLIQNKVRFGYVEAPLYYCRRHLGRLTYQK